MVHRCVFAPARVRTPEHHQPSSIGESKMNCKHHFRSSAIACLGLCALMTLAFGADTVKLTVSEAVQLALRQNRVLKIARLKVAENEQKKAGAKSDYFPAIKNQSSVARTTAQENIIIPTGAFGLIPNIGP